MSGEPTLQNHEARLLTLEKSQQEFKDALASIQSDLKDKSVNDAKMASVLDNTAKDVTELKTSVKDMSDKLLEEILQERKAERDDNTREKKFYQDIIWKAIVIAGTIILGAFGVKELLFR